MGKPSLAASILLGCVLTTVAVPNAPNNCKCLSTDSCWPNSSDLDKLASEVTQPLVHPIPPASPCYPASSPSGNCTEVQENWMDGNWRSDRVGAMQAPNYETFTFANESISACYLNTTLGAPCEQGNIPVIGVDARGPSDIQAAVKFASTHNLRLVIKNTGHDFLGRSAARDSFVIWTHNMKNITIHDVFTPSGAPANETYPQAITLGAGVQWHEAYDAASSVGHVLVGGLAAGGSVGAAGGWIQGGGHSALSPAYGLGVDNVLEMTVVTADGEHLTANSHQNQDLFWALRGGGGGTFGVVTSVTYRTRPDGQIISGFLTTSIKANTTGSTPILVKLLSEFFRHSTNLTDGGWGGYIFTSPSAPGEAMALQLILIAPNATWAQANETFNPLLQSAAALAANSSFENGGALNITTGTAFPFDSFKAWRDMFFTFATGQVGGNTIIGSRLFPKTVLENNATELAETILEFPDISFYLVAGGAVSKPDPDSAGLNPAWRKAGMHSVWGDTWPEGTSASEINTKVALLKQRLEIAHRIVPDSGAYFNEASLFENNFQQTFFGDHYPKLKEIKKRYDPGDLFVVPKGVGSEDWDELLHCRV